MATDPSPKQPVEAQLGVWDAVSIIVGIVVGAGIYETPPFILQQLSGPGLALAVWAVAGLLCLVGALCYAELATTYPRSGGDYVYLTRAYGPWAGFLFGWAHLAVVLTANIGMMAYVFADYAVRLFEFGEGTKFVYAASAVIVLTLLNILGVAFGKGVQNFLTAAKVLGLSGIVVAALLSSSGGTPVEAKPTELDFTKIAFALVLMFLTYGGWNDAAFVAAEVRDGRRNIPRALVLGVTAITVIYLLINAAYMWALGFEGARQSGAIAADVLKQRFGEPGEKFISVLVMISALGAANGLIFTGARVCSTLGADYGIFAWLGGWNARLGTPVAALVAQALIALAMIVLVGTEVGQRAADAAFTGVGLPKVQNWAGRSGFETLLKCTAPIFWTFFALTALSLFVLRVKDAQLPRPFSVPLFPLTPLVFLATCGYMIYSGINYAEQFGWVGAAVVAAGLPLYFVSGRRVPEAGPAASE